MAKRSTTSNRLAPPGVHGLEGSRKLADQRHRRKKRKDRISSSAVFVVFAGFVGGAAYVGYTMYTEQQRTDEDEHVRRVAELQAQRDARSTDELIVQLRDSPRWNGPGTPAFGVGEDPADQIVITPPPEP